MCKPNRFLFLAIWVLASCFAISASPPTSVKEIRVAAGQTGDLWLGVNVSGKVNYAIRTKDRSNKMRMWWIMKPLGNVKQLGTLAGNGSLDIPDKLNASISAKLRGKANVDTIVYIGENVEVDNSKTFNW
jgi:hypothetical protein